MSWVRNIPSPTLKGISKSLRRRGKQVREILESSILPADSGIPNAPALTKLCTGMYLTCFRRLWWCYQICNSARWGRNTILHSQTMWMSGLQFLSSRKNEGLEGTDDGNSCKSNPRVVVCTHLYALSIGNSVECNEGLLRWKIVKWHIVLQRYQHLGCWCHPNGSKYCSNPCNTLVKPMFLPEIHTKDYFQWWGMRGEHPKHKGGCLKRRSPDWIYTK